MTRRKRLWRLAPLLLCLALPLVYGQEAGTELGNGWDDTAGSNQ